MGTVKRYDLQMDGNYGVERMMEAAFGEYVTHDDYVALEAEFKKMKEDRDELGRVVETVKTELSTIEEQLQRALYGK